MHNLPEQEIQMVNKYRSSTQPLQQSEICMNCMLDGIPITLPITGPAVASREDGVERDSDRAYPNAFEPDGTFGLDLSKGHSIPKVWFFYWYHEKYA
jgi:hypothetical protein